MSEKPVCEMPFIPELLEYDRCLMRKKNCSSKHKKALKALLKKLPFLGSGWSRHVFDVDGKCVLKFGGEYISRQELEVWNRVKGIDELARFFAPVYVASKKGGFLLMKKADRTIEYSELSDFKRDFFDTFEFFCEDMGIDNIGVFNNEVKIIDYNTCLLEFRRGIGKPWRN